jgi:hypothetical protein
MRAAIEQRVRRPAGRSTRHIGLMARALELQRDTSFELARVTSDGLLVTVATAGGKESARSNSASCAEPSSMLSGEELSLCARAS